jgi:hypothetical protein
MGMMRNENKIFIGKPVRTISLGKLRQRREDTIKMYLKFSVRIHTGFIWLKIGFSCGLFFSTVVNLWAS